MNSLDPRKENSYLAKSYSARFRLFRLTTPLRSKYQIRFVLRFLK